MTPGEAGWQAALSLAFARVHTMRLTAEMYDDSAAYGLKKAEGVLSDFIGRCERQLPSASG